MRIPENNRIIYSDPSSCCYGSRQATCHHYHEDGDFRVVESVQIKKKKNREKWSNSVKGRSTGSCVVGEVADERS